jgi:CCR4-NOT transcriptional complex subunit CAF120
MDMGNNVNGRDTPPSAQHMSADQQQARRRTQSLRPLSAFQPLDHLDNGIVGNGNGDRPASPAGSTTRSIRTAAAPLTFKSPELRSALGLQDAQNKKIYMEGYLSRRDHLTAEGKPLNMSDPKKRWHLCFVQLSGTVLSVWSVQQMEEAARMGTEVPPSYINVTDCVSCALIHALIDDLTF